VFVGDQLSVDVHAPDQRNARVALRRVDNVRKRGDEGKRDLIDVQRVPRGAGDVRLQFDTNRLQPGAYEAVLLFGGHEAVSRSPFWLYEAGTSPSITSAQDSYGVDEPITVSWKAAPGLRRDWIAVYRCLDTECDPNSAYLVWAYTDAAIEGSLEIGPDSFEGIESWPLPAGTYVVRLLTDDSFIDLATSPRFTIG
jgi:hypothetical protein